MNWRFRIPVLVVSGCYLVGLVAMSVAAAGSGTVGWDRRISRALQDLDGPVWGALSGYGNFVGETAVALTITVAAMLVMLMRHRLAEAALLGAMAMFRALNWPLKWVFDSPRPATSPDGTNSVATGLGYPSGHAMGAIMVVGAITLVVFRITPSRRWRIGTALFAILTVTATGIGRVTSQAHWPSDVVGGYLFGAGFLVVVVALVAWADHRQMWHRIPASSQH